MNMSIGSPLRQFLHAVVVEAVVVYLLAIHLVDALGGIKPCPFAVVLIQAYCEHLQVKIRYAA